MANETSRNIKLGVLVIAGTVLLIAALYLIGNKQNLFGSTYSLSARFYNVNGLMKGNNVRFAGIDVGTVGSVRIENDSTVTVKLILENSVKRFIKKNATASVGTDGLMGNKLVNISINKEPAPPAEEGDVLASLRPIEMDDMVRTLDITNENMRAISDNLRSITSRISSRNTLWTVLLDTQVAVNLKAAVTNVRLMTDNGNAAMASFRRSGTQLEAGKGTLGVLLRDTVIPVRVTKIVRSLEQTGDSAVVLSAGLAKASRKINGREGSLGILLNDSSVALGLQRSTVQIEKGAAGFSENMEALKHTWPLKRYFRKRRK